MKRNNYSTTVRSSRKGVRITTKQLEDLSYTSYKNGYRQTAKIKSKEDFLNTDFQKFFLRLN